GINCLRGVFKGSRRRVKIMKADGTVMKLWSPVHVKELLGDYPDNQIFEADDTHRLSMISRPLSQSVELRPGQLYFLIPLSTQPPASATTSGPEICGKSSSDTDLRIEKRDDNKSKLNRGALQIISSTVRLRIRLTKEEVSSLLSVDGNNLMEDIVAPLIKLSITNKPQKSWDSLSRQWEPSLDTISE
ncbi:hypothetical protein KI387_039134, partial [Taxus chinensis]